MDNSVQPTPNAEPTRVSTWEQLAQMKSDTYIIEIDLRFGCGWLRPKPNADPKLNRKHYLTTHTFYEDYIHNSTKLLQNCGFNVELIGES